MSFTLYDIWAFLRRYPWWAGPAMIAGLWITLRIFARRWHDYVEGPRFSDHGFEQNGVRVNFANGTITLRHGDTLPVSRVRSLRWEDYASKGGLTYYAFIDLDDLARPIRQVPFSKPDMPEEFVARLRTAIERAGGPRLVMSGCQKFDLIGRDISDPITAAIATKVVGQGRRVSYAAEAAGVSERP